MIVRHYYSTACNYSYMQLGLMDFNARFYSPTLGRFIQPDTIIPNLINSQAWNRYTYVLNSPIMYVDPSGHMFISQPGSGPPCIDGDCSGQDELIEEFENNNGLVNNWYNFTLPKPPGNITSDIEISIDLINPEILLMMNAVDPLHNPSSNYHGFGSCSTDGHNSCNYHHPAVDVGPGDEVNPNIYSIGYGDVTYVGEMFPGFGNYLIIRHNINGENFYSVYAHLSTVTVDQGDMVDSNTVIGQMGNTGTGDVHLHFEVRTSLGVNSQGTGFRGSGAHPNVPGDAYWAYSQQDLAAYWGNLTLLSWVDGYDPEYGTWP